MGIKITEYPFNTKTLAKKSIERFVRSLSKSHFVDVAKRNGDQAFMIAKIQERAIKQPYDHKTP